MLSAETYTMLANLDPDSLNFHAARYVSGELFQEAIFAAQENQPIDHVELILIEAANACDEQDGADWESIPCLGGEPLDVWLSYLSS